MVANSAGADSLAECFGLIRENAGEELHSLWFNSNCSSTNTILGPELERVFGPESVVEHFGGAAVHYPPGAFGQSNLEVAEELVAHLRGQIPERARVAEFYAGVGAIGLSILERVREIRMNELSPHSLRGLELGLRQLRAADRAKVSVIAGPAGAALEAAQGADVVIADPPRKGLDPQLASHLREHPPERLLYVSCGLASLLHDIAQLTAAGGMRLAALTAFNLMPYTDHVETLAILERR
jgi:23S rRNA (uracil1939-C5)-methyltransferase